MELQRCELSSCWDDEDKYEDMMLRHNIHLANTQEKFNRKNQLQVGAICLDGLDHITTVLTDEKAQKVNGGDKNTNQQCLHQVEDRGYESSVSQEKQDALNRSRNTDSERPSLKIDKEGRLLLETPDDLQNLLLLRKTKREQKAAARKPAAASPAVHSVPYYVDEDDFLKACDHKQLQVIDRYLSTGGDVNACDAFERTGLHRACSKGHIEVVSRLLEAGADIHSRDKLWSTCVHSACRGGNLSVLQLVLDHGADISATDKGRSPLDGVLEWQNEAKTLLVQQNDRK
ncbi:hypothetical protein PAMA_012063 [Pampus argenteus]